MIAFVIPNNPDGPTIYLCNEALDRRNNRYQAEELGQILVHEAAHLVGYLDECDATTFEVGIMQNSSFGLRFKNGYWPKCFPQSSYSIYFKNKCRKNIDIAIRYKNTETNSWTTEAWFDFVPGERSRIAQTKNSIFYYHAHSRDSDWGGDRSYSINGKIYSFRRTKISGDDFRDYTKGLTCD